MRELSWRLGKAGEKITEAEAQVFGQKGLRPHDGMKIYDAIRLVNHILGCTTGQSLINYQLGPWPAMEPGSVRFWCDDAQRWRRTSPTMMALVNPPPPGDKMDTPQDTAELEDKYTEFASLPLDRPAQAGSRTHPCGTTAWRDGSERDLHSRPLPPMME